MNLTEELTAERAHWAAIVPADKGVLMRADLDRLRDSELPERALRLSERAPNFRLADARGEAVELDQLLLQGPVVLVFYRGQWCPYCNLELRAYQRALPQLQALGASLLAISPQTPDNTLSTAEKNELAFPVLSDVGSHVARGYGLAFDIPPVLQAVYSQFFGNDLQHYNAVAGSGADGWTLPIPAVFVIGTDQRVALAHIDVDYRQRLEPDAVLAALRQSRLAKLA